MGILCTDWCRIVTLTWKENKGFESYSKGFLTEREMKSLYINYFVGFIEMIQDFRTQGLPYWIRLKAHLVQILLRKIDEPHSRQMWDNLSPIGVSSRSLEISLNQEAWGLISVLKSLLPLIMATWDILEIHINVQSLFKACWILMALQQWIEMAFLSPHSVKTCQL